jgi:hypothetical protein
MATLSVGGQLVATNDTLSNGVQDNITRLGTVTAGTLASSVTFPSGHILQCKGDRYDYKAEGASINATNSSTTPFGASFEVPITCASTSNFLKIDYFIPDVYTASNASGVHCGIVYDTNSFASGYTGLPGTAGTDSDGQYEVAPYTLYGVNTGGIFNITVMLYCSVPTTSAIKIRPYLQSHGSETYTTGANYVAHSSQCSMTVMEIQA